MSLADKVKSKCRECKSTTRQLDTKNVKVEELKLGFWLSVDEGGRWRDVTTVRRPDKEAGRDEKGIADKGS